MARPSRTEYPGAYYRVIDSGNGGDNVFAAAGERKKEKTSELWDGRIAERIIEIPTK